jgi:formylglycine-generating enzyme required for sulfatase activity
MNLKTSILCALGAALVACGGEGAGRPRPVALKAPNAWGLYDTSGNAFEWTNDLYQPLGYGKGTLENPLFGVADASDLTPKAHPVYGEGYRTADGFSGYRVCRGGAFDLWSIVAKSGRRAHGAGVGGQHNGFRLVRSILGAAARDAL